MVLLLSGAEMIIKFSEAVQLVFELSYSESPVVQSTG